MLDNTIDNLKTIKKNSNNTLGKINQLYYRFILNLQHDIKTPINNILGLINIISKEKLPEKIRSHINYLEIASKALGEFISEISHKRSLKNKLFKENKENFLFNLPELIKKSIDLNIISIKDKNLKLYLRQDDSIPKLLIGNKIILYRIFINLLENSLKFTNSGSLHIHTRLISLINLGSNNTTKNIKYQKAIIEVVIADTGIGISPADLQKIFKKFTKLSYLDFKNDCNSGLGLGLWMVKHFIKKLNAKLSVTSKVGQGTKFKFIFPCKVLANY